MVLSFPCATENEAMPAILILIDLLYELMYLTISSLAAILSQCISRGVLILHLYLLRLLFALIFVHILIVNYICCLVAKLKIM